MKLYKIFVYTGNALTDGLIINFDIYNLARTFLIKIVKETVLHSDHKSPPRWNLNINVLKTTLDPLQGSWTKY